MREKCGRGRGLCGGQEKEWMGYFLDDLRAIGINAEQWTTASQDEGGWRRTTEQGAEHFIGLSAVNAIGTQLPEPINMGLTRWRMAV